MVELVDWGLSNDRPTPSSTFASTGNNAPRSTRIGSPSSPIDELKASYGRVFKQGAPSDALFLAANEVRRAIEGKMFYAAARAWPGFTKAAEAHRKTGRMDSASVERLASEVAQAWVDAGHANQALRALPFIQNEERREQLAQTAQERRALDVIWLLSELDTIQLADHQSFARQVWAFAEERAPGCPIPSLHIRDGETGISWNLAHGAFGIEFDEDGDYVWAARDHISAASASGQSECLQEILADKAFADWLTRTLDVPR